MARTPACRKPSQSNPPRSTSPGTAANRAGTPSKWPWRKITFHLGLLGGIALLCVALYGKTLHYPFIFDDQFYLETNPIYKDLSHFLGASDFQTAATQAQTLKLDPDLSTNFVLRQFSYLTFYWDYKAHGLNPSGYRLENILLHWCNAWLVFLLATQLLRRSRSAESLAPSSARFIPLVASLLFLVHPLQTESVTYVVQRFTSLGTFFYLGTLIAYFQSRGAQRPLGTWTWRVVSVLALLLGMLSKEIVFTAPLMVVALECLLMRTPWRQALKQAAAHLLFLPLIPVLVLMASAAQHHGKLSLANAYNIVNPIFTPVSPWTYVLTQTHVLVRYVTLFFAPFGLNVDHDYPLTSSLLDPRVWGALLLITGTIAAAVWTFRRYKDVRVSVLCVGSGWFLLTAFVPAGLIPLPDVMAEHRTYLPSVGLLIAAACALDLWRTRWMGRPWLSALAPAAAVVAVLVLSGLTNIRNEVWSSRVNLWQDTVAKSPNKSRSWYNLGMVQYEMGQKEAAVESLQRAVNLDGSFGFAYLSLGAYQADLGHPDDAIDTFHKGIALFPSSSKLYYNLGVMTYRQGRVGEARDAFEKAVHWEPEDRGSRLWLARICEEGHDHEAALSHLQIADTLQPGDAQLHAAMSQIQQEINVNRARTGTFINTR